jgi:serine-type D-Ala-D-Ala carboxypeptidase/endopeptidase (penicillin-binding protein 4)
MRRLRRSLSGIILAGAMLLEPSPGRSQSPTRGGICPADLPQQIQAIVDRPEWAPSQWGIMVQRLDSQSNQRQTIYSYNGQKRFIPASNAKLFTTAAALQGLGPNYRIRTSVYGKEVLPGVWQLHLVGRGDPSLTDRQLQDLAAQLQRQGIKQVSQMVLDDRYFGDDVVNPAWEWGGPRAHGESKCVDD